LHEHCQDGQLTAEPRRSPREGGLLHINEEVKMIQYQLLKTNIKTHFSQVRQLKTPLIDFLMEPSNVDYPRILVFVSAVGAVSFCAGIVYQLTFG
jgi:hypothetical protein